MNVTTTTIINYRNCPYTIGTENLANLRRVQLQRLASAIGIVGDWPKNDLLTRLIAYFDAHNVDKDLAKVAGAKEALGA